jgi:hypothetical protein
MNIDDRQGMEENGVTVMFQRMREAKQTCEEIKSFYKERWVNFFLENVAVME